FLRALRAADKPGPSQTTKPPATHVPAAAGKPRHNVEAKCGRKLPALHRVRTGYRGLRRARWWRPSKPLPLKEKPCEAASTARQTRRWSRPCDGVFFPGRQTE